MQSEDNTTIESSIVEEEEEDLLPTMDVSNKYVNNNVGLYSVSGWNVSDPNLTSLDPKASTKAMKEEILGKGNHPNVDAASAYPTDSYIGNNYSAVSSHHQNQSGYPYSRNKKQTVSEDNGVSEKNQGQEQLSQNHPPPPNQGYYYGPRFHHGPPPHHGPPYFGPPYSVGSLSSNNLIILLISAVTLAGVVHFGVNSVPSMQTMHPTYMHQHPAMVPNESLNEMKSQMKEKQSFQNKGEMTENENVYATEYPNDLDNNNDNQNFSPKLKGSIRKKNSQGFYDMNDDMAMPNTSNGQNAVNNQQQNLVPVYDQNGNPMLDQNGNMMMIMQPNLQQGNNGMMMQGGNTMVAPVPNFQTSNNAMTSFNGQQMPVEQQMSGVPEQQPFQMTVPSNAETMGVGTSENQLQTNSDVGSDETDRQTLFPLNEMNNFKDNWDQWERSDVPVFLHIPKAGGSTIKDIIGTCHRFVMATEMGITDGHANETEIAIIYPGGGPVGQDRSPFVNVDTTTVEGILRAKEMGFADSGLADAVVTPFVYEANDLFTPTAKGRLFTVFRHPIERAISMFYYIQVADWEPTYDPELKDWTIAQYAKSSKIENNWLTRQLSNHYEGDIDVSHLDLAMEVIRRKFMVGLMNQIEETMERFERFFRWTYHVNPPNQEACRERLLKGGSNKNSSGKKKEKPKEGSEEWELLAWQNQYDLQLYQYIESLFKEQEQFVADIPVGFRLEDATCCKCGPPTYPPEGFTCPEAVLN